MENTAVPTELNIVEAGYTQLNQDLKEFQDEFERRRDYAAKLSKEHPSKVSEKNRVTLQSAAVAAMVEIAEDFALPPDESVANLVRFLKHKSSQLRQRHKTAQFNLSVAAKALILEEPGSSAFQEATTRLAEYTGRVEAFNAGFSLFSDMVSTLVFRLTGT